MSQVADKEPEVHEQQRSGGGFCLLEVPPAELAAIQALYDGGKNLAAFRASQAVGPLARWAGPVAQTLAGRLAGNVGGYRLARVLHWRAWRADPSHPNLIAYYGATLLQCRGALAARERIERSQPRFEGVDADGQAHWFTIQGEIAAAFRDFEGAHAHLQRAVELTPSHPWVQVTRAHVLEQEDRYAEAMAAARYSLQLVPWFRPGVQSVAHLLQLLDRDEEALGFLTEAAGHVENVHVVRQLFGLQMDLERYAEAAATLERLVELAPLMEKAEREWLRGVRVRLHCCRGERQAALVQAGAVDDPYHKALASRLATDQPFRNVRLEVPFVRQHQATCAPATLAALSRFWQQPAEHLEVAEAICYDGTPAHSERHWADTHGWVTREFTVTWEAAVTLLERRIPFTLTTSETTSSHLQAVVGFDELQRVLWIRDPFLYGTQAYPVELLLERYRSTGPRGMAMVPASRRELLDGLDLPDAPLYDQLHEVERALAEHRRADALAACEGMGRSAPEHRLTLAARRAIASYDANTPALLECVERLLKQFPDDGHLLLAKLGCLQQLARPRDRLELLEAICSRNGSHPIFWQQYAQELRGDARRRPAAVSWARWALRYRPTDATLLKTWADLLWDEGRWEKAAGVYRLVACLGDKREELVRPFFVAACYLRQSELAVRFLREREQRLGSLSGFPSITLVESLQHLRRTSESLQTLEAALGRRPQDGSLQLFGADFYGRFSRFETAQECLEAARGQCAPAAWHRGAALVAQYQRRKGEALGHWRQVLEYDPLEHEAIQNAALLLAETEGLTAALTFLEQLCARFPYCCPLLDLRVTWLKENGPEAVLPHLRHLLEIHPADTWAWRELALQAADSGRFAEAMAAAEEAVRLDPGRSVNYSVRGDILMRSGKPAEGRADLRQAICLEVDNGWALVNYVGSAGTPGEREEALGIVNQELRRQVIVADALHAYQVAARGLYPPAEVLALLREAHSTRPELWQAWSVLVAQLTDMGQHDEALQLAHQATERFPLLPRLWVDLARVELARLEPAGEIAALEKALEISPGFAVASRQLAEVYQRQGLWKKAQVVLEEALTANPLDAQLHARLAVTLWQEEARAEAIARLRRALELEPGLDWGWNSLREWGAETDQPGLAADMARALTQTRGGEPRSWLMLAACLKLDQASPGAAPSTLAQKEYFASLDKALELNPRCEDAYDQRAWGLTQLGRFEEALGQCQPAGLQPVPVGLRLRAAWIEAYRGNLPHAITLAKTALSEHPDSYRGWQMLAEWQVHANQLEEAVVAAEKMAALAPLDPVPLGYAGDLKLRLNDRAGARAAFDRAFRLDPGYEYAGFHLFRLQLRAQEYDQADATLQVLAGRGQTPGWLSSSVQLAAARQRWSEAWDLLDRLLVQKQADETSLAQAFEPLDQPQHRKRMDGLLDKYLAPGHGWPALAVFWVQRQVGWGRWKLHRRLAALKAEGELGRQAVIAYLSLMGDACASADFFRSWLLRSHLRRLLRRHRDWLEDDVEGWGKVGYVLACIGRPGPVIAWLGNWKEHANVESWMLYNLIVAFQRRGRFEASREVIRHAVTLPHGGELYGAFRLWAAFEAALQGNLAEAEKNLSGLEEASVKDDFKPIRVMTELLLALQAQPAAQRPGFVPTLKARLKSVFGSKHPAETSRYTRTGYQRFLAVAGQNGTGWGFKLWGRCFYRGLPWYGLALLILLLLPALVVAPPLLIGLLFILNRRSPRD